MGNYLEERKKSLESGLKEFDETANKWADDHLPPVKKPGRPKKAGWESWAPEAWRFIFSLGGGVRKPRPIHGDSGRREEERTCRLAPEQCIEVSHSSDEVTPYPEPPGTTPFSPCTVDCSATDEENHEEEDNVQAESVTITSEIQPAGPDTASEPSGEHPGPTPQQGPTRQAPLTDSSTSADGRAQTTSLPEGQLNAETADPDRLGPVQRPVVSTYDSNTSSQDFPSPDNESDRAPEERLPYEPDLSEESMGEIGHRFPNENGFEIHMESQHGRSETIATDGNADYRRTTSSDSTVIVFRKQDITITDRIDHNTGDRNRQIHVDRTDDARTHFQELDSAGLKPIINQNQNPEIHSANYGKLPSPEQIKKEFEDLNRQVDAQLAEGNPKAPIDNPIKQHRDFRPERDHGGKDPVGEPKENDRKEPISPTSELEEGEFVSDHFDVQPTEPGRHWPERPPHREKPVTEPKAHTPRSEKAKTALPKRRDFPEDQPPARRGREIHSFRPSRTLPRPIKNEPSLGQRVFNETLDIDSILGTVVSSAELAKRGSARSHRTKAGTRFEITRLKRGSGIYYTIKGPRGAYPSIGGRYYAARNFSKATTQSGKTLARIVHAPSAMKSGGAVGAILSAFGTTFDYAMDSNKELFGHDYYVDVGFDVAKGLISTAAGSAAGAWLVGGALGASMGSFAPGIGTVAGFAVGVYVAVELEDLLIEDLREYYKTDLK